MEFLKEKWREVTTVLGIIVIAVLLFALVNFLLQKKEDVVFNNEIVERKYNDIVSGETSEVILEEELAKIKEENEKLSEILPDDYRIQEAQADLVEVVKSNKILNIEKCTVTELDVRDGDKYKKIQVTVRDFYGTYEQIKEFLDYIQSFHTKTVIEKIQFQKEDKTDNMKGQSLVFSFYSAV